MSAPRRAIRLQDIYGDEIFMKVRPYDEGISIRFTELDQDPTIMVFDRKTLKALRKALKELSQ